MPAGRLFLVFILCTLCYGTNCLETSPLSCLREEDILVCENGVLPTTLVRSVTLKDVQFGKLQELGKVTAGGDGNNITNLQVLNGQGNALPIDSFVNLSGLQHLKIQGDWLEHLQQGVFENVPYLRTLDLSLNPVLTVNAVENAIQSRKTGSVIMPFLETFLITSLNSNVIASLLLPDSFFEAIAHKRHVKYLDISYTAIQRFDFNQLKELCDNGLKHLGIRGLILSEIHPSVFSMKCDQLTTLDARGIRPALSLPTLAQYTGEVLCEIIYIFPKLQNFYLDSVFPADAFTDLGTVDDPFTTSLVSCRQQLHTLSLANNYIRSLNLYVELGDNKEFLRVFDLSNNGLEYFSKTSLGIPLTMSHMDLSHNELWKMFDSYPSDVEAQFVHLKNLIDINLSVNKLKWIPFNLFVHNERLVNIDLSFNILESFNIETEQLTHLETLNLAGNKIKHFDDEMVSRFEKLYASQGKALRVNVSQNEFDCTCEENSLRTYTFLKSEMMTHSAGHKSNIVCKLEGSDINIMTSDINFLTDFCHMKNVVQIIWITSTILGIVLISLGIVLGYNNYKTRWENHRARHRGEIIDLINGGEFIERKLVFLCFCSEDEDFVNNSVYPELNRALQNLINTERDLLCFGDAHFRPGFPVIDEIDRLIKSASVVFAVVSNSFCAKHWCEQELHFGINNKKPMIMLLKERIDEHQMPPVVRNHFHHFTRALWKLEGENGHPVPGWLDLGKAILELAHTEEHDRQLLINEENRIRDENNQI